MKKTIDIKWLIIISTGLLLGLYFSKQLFVLITLILIFLFIVIVLEQDFMSNFLPKVITLLIIITLVFWSIELVQLIFGIISAVFIVSLTIYYIIRKRNKQKKNQNQKKENLRNLKSL